MADTKIMIFKIKDEVKVHDFMASIYENGDLLLSEWFYYPNPDGREYEYNINIPADEKIKFSKYLQELSNDNLIIQESISKEEQFLLQLKQLFENNGFIDISNKKFTRITDNVCCWLKKAEINYKYSPYISP